MSVLPSTESLVEFTPQVQAARQAAQRQDIGIAVLAKSRDVAQAQAEAVLQQLQAVGAVIEGLGQHLDARV